MSDQKDAGADDKNTIPLDELNFALTADDLQRYLAHVRPSGYPCPLCHSMELHPILASSAQGEEARVYPSTMTPELYPRLPPTERTYLAARGNYELVCMNCGHSVGFNAAMVAGRLALWKKAEGNG